MSMRTLLIALFLLSLGVLASASPVVQPSYTPTHEPVYVDKVSIFSDDGNASFETGNINGYLVGIGYQNGNFTGNGTIRVNQTYPFDYPITTYNLSAGNYTTNTSFSGYGLPLFGKVSLSLSYQQDNKSATVYLMYR